MEGGGRDRAQGEGEGEGRRAVLFFALCFVFERIGI